MRVPTAQWGFIYTSIFVSLDLVVCLFWRAHGSGEPHEFGRMYVASSIQNRQCYPGLSRETQWMCSYYRDQLMCLWRPRCPTVCYLWMGELREPGMSFVPTLKTWIWRRPKFTSTLTQDHSTPKREPHWPNEEVGCPSSSSEIRFTLLYLHASLSSLPAWITPALLTPVPGVILLKKLSLGRWAFWKGSCCFASVHHEHPRIASSFWHSFFVHYCISLYSGMVWVITF